MIGSDRSGAGTPEALFGPRGEWLAARVRAVLQELEGRVVRCEPRAGRVGDLAIVRRPAQVTGRCIGVEEAVGLLERCESRPLVRDEVDGGAAREHGFG